LHETLARGQVGSEAAPGAASDGDADGVVVGCSPGQLGDRVAVADLELPRGIDAGEDHLAVEVAAIRERVLSDGDLSGVADVGGKAEGMGANDVDGDDAVAGQGGLATCGCERHQGLV
jgi:hypothetical protein